MEFVKEYFDEKVNKYVYEYNITQEEKETLDGICEKEKLSIDELIEKILTYYINHPQENCKFIKEYREDKNLIGTIGKPKYKKGDTIGFYFKPSDKDYDIFCIGKVEIVDAYGTFEQNNEPSYDIMVDNFNNKGPCLFKHILESETYDI